MKMLCAAALLFVPVLALADQVDDVRDGTDLVFDLKGMNYSYSGAMSGSGTVLDEDAPPARVEKPTGTLNFVLDTTALGLGFSIQLPMTGTKLGPDRVRWSTDTDVNQCITVLVNGTPTQLRIRRVRMQLTTTASFIPTFFDETAMRSYNVRMDDSGGNPENFFTAEAYAFCVQNIFTRVDFTGTDIDSITHGGLGRLAPNNISILRGLVLSGNLQSIIESDDVYVTARPGITFSTSEAPLQIILDSTSTAGATTELRFTLESRAAASNINQRIELFNFATGVYDLIDLRAAPTTDTALTFIISANPSEYVEPTTRALKAKISYKAAGPVFSYPWLVHIDQAQWRVAP